MISFKFLNSTPARIVTIGLLLQGGLLYSSIRPEFIPTSVPLSQLPTAVDGWNMFQEGVIEPEIQEVLQADDLLNRDYRRPNTVPVNLFIAAFRSQRAGKAPHSPKNCLPGSGWVQLDDKVVAVDVGLAQPIQVNRYIVSNGAGAHALVLYWYQSRDRVVADEFKAKIWVMADAMRYNRTDTALVRVVVSFDPKQNFDDHQAEKVATEFVHSFYGTIRQHLPS
ncbi:MAG: exosortase C-terminal domain/associated protein EpsI [Acidobacteriota bacterium]